MQHCPPRVTKGRSSREQARLLLKYRAVPFPLLLVVVAVVLFLFVYTQSYDSVSFFFIQRP